MKCGFTPFAAMFRWSALADPADRLLPATDERDTHKWTMFEVERIGGLSDGHALQFVRLLFDRVATEIYHVQYQIPWWTDEL